MKVSYNWLKEFVDIPVTAKKLAEDLGLFGFEVESVSKDKNDYILDIKITANRGDCLSILGIAREISALYNLRLVYPNYTINDQILNKKIDVTITDPKMCPRFTARIIDNVEIKKSPKWLKEKLHTYGFRPINNIVDITNLVMVELGQPLHAFDFHKIDCGKMIIRRAKTEERLFTLDGKERNLDSDSIIIEDEKKVYDLAGLMGGLNSEITDKTKTIILQASIFDPILIRRTAKRLKLTTDASYRFERKVDFEGIIKALNQASFLIKDICGSEVQVGSLTDIKNPIKRVQKITINDDKIINFIGKKFKHEEIYNNLKRLNVICKNNICQIPSYRQNDLVMWQALAGEAARISGFDKLSREKNTLIKNKKNSDFIKKEYLKDLLAANGFTEIYSYSFSDEKLLNLLGENLKNCYYVTNSVAPENKYLRPNLLPSLLTCAAKNPWAPEINIFEIGKVFGKSDEEKWQIGLATTQKKADNIKKILNLLNLRSEIECFDQKILDYLKIRRTIKYAIVDFKEVKIQANKYLEKFNNKKFKSISEFPPTIRDLAIVVNPNINSEDVLNEIYQVSKNIFLVELFDEFTSDKIGKNKKSSAYHIWMQNLERPMNDIEPNKIVDKVIKNLNNKFGAKLRG